MSEQRRVICPVCWHEETMRARRLEQEPCRDDVIMMHWRPPWKEWLPIPPSDERRG